MTHLYRIFINKSKLLTDQLQIKVSLLKNLQIELYINTQQF